MKNFNVFLFTLVALVFLGSCTVAPTSKQYAVESDAFNGKMTVHEGPGVKDYTNFFDAVTYYDKVDSYSFSAALDEGEAEDESIGIRFANNGIAYLSGSTDYRYPSGENKTLMTDIDENYGSAEAVEQQLIRQALENSAFTAGQFMNVFDALSKNRSFLKEIIFDQANNGQYQVSFKEATVVDIATGKEKVVKVSDRIECTDLSNPNCVGGYMRTEPSPLKLYGIQLFNFTVKRLTGEKSIEEAIAANLRRSNKMEELSIQSREAQVQSATTIEKSKSDVAIKEAETAIAVAEAKKATAVAEEEMKQAKFEADASFYNKQKEAEADKLKVTAGLSPERAAHWKFRQDSVISANLSNIPTPLFINTSNSAEALNLQSMYGMERALVFKKQLEKDN